MRQSSKHIRCSSTQWSILLSFLFLVIGSRLQSETIRHSFLTLGPKATAIIGEEGDVVWQYRAGSRDGFVLPNGNILVNWSQEVLELTRDKEVVFSYKLDPRNREIGTAQRLYNGNTLVTELGAEPRLLEISTDGKVKLSVPLLPETDNAHMQTRMARQLRNGNFLVPHLLAFAVKEYGRDGSVLRTFRTDLKEVGGRKGENWPFTAIRLDSGNTLISLTHGNKVVEMNPEAHIVWKVSNDDVGGLFKDPCGCQRLANGNTVIGSHGVRQGITMVEVDRDRNIVWQTDHPLTSGVHHFQILTTNGQPEPGMPLK